MPLNTQINALTQIDSFAFDESGFRKWYTDMALRTGLNPDPDDPRHHYDYRAAYRAGAEPEIGDDGNYHWPSDFKAPDHPNRYVNGVDTITGRPANALTVDLDSLMNEAEASAGIAASPKTAGQTSKIQDLDALLDETYKSVMSEKSFTTMGVVKATGRGAAEGLTTELPGMVGGAAQFVGEKTGIETLEGAGKAVKEWSKEKAKEWFGDTENLPTLEKVAYEGSKMLAPSVIPGGLAATAWRILRGVGGLVRGARAAQAAGNAAKAAELIEKATSIAKQANNVGGGAAGVLFGLSQAQNTMDSAEQTAQSFEAQGKTEEARKAREAGQGIAPYATGAIEAVGEFFGTKYLGKLLGVTDIEKRAPKELAKQFLRTLGVEIGTEMGQTAGEAGVEKIAGARPNADILQETLDVIGPTAFMTLLTGGLAAGAQATKKAGTVEKETEPKPAIEQTPKAELAGAPTSEEEINRLFQEAEAAAGLTPEKPAEEKPIVQPESLSGPSVEVTEEAEKGGELISPREEPVQETTEEELPASNLDGKAEDRIKLLRSELESLKGTTGKKAKKRRKEIRAGIGKLNVIIGDEQKKAKAETEKLAGGYFTPEKKKAGIPPHPEMEPEPAFTELRTMLRGKTARMRPEVVKIDTAATEAATSPENDLPEPTQAQVEVGNYRKGHVNVQGLEISIENPKGSTRKGKDKDGKEWSVTLPAHYGYVHGVNGKGADGDHVDVYIGENPESEKVFIVNQKDINTGKFDELKATLGTDNARTAVDIYTRGFSDGKGFDRIDSVYEMSIQDFKEFLNDGKGNRKITGTERNARPVEASDLQDMAQHSRQDEQPKKPVLPQLRGERDQGSSDTIQLQRVPEGSGGEAVTSPSDRQDRQQRGLRAGQSEMGNEEGAGTEHAKDSLSNGEWNQKIPDRMGRRNESGTVNASLPSLKGNERGTGGENGGQNERKKVVKQGATAPISERPEAMPAKEPEVKEEVLVLKQKEAEIPPVESWQKGLKVYEVKDKDTIREWTIARNDPQAKEIKTVEGSDMPLPYRHLRGMVNDGELVLSLPEGFVKIEDGIYKRQAKSDLQKPKKEEVEQFSISLTPPEARTIGQVSDNIRRWLSYVLPKDVMSRTTLELKPLWNLKDIDLSKAKRSMEEHGITEKDGNIVLGATTVNDLTALIKMSYHFNDDILERTAYHEGFHVASRLLLPEADYQTVIDHFKTEEAAAKAFGEWAQGKAKETPSTIRRVFHAMRRALRYLKSRFVTLRGAKTPEQVFAKIWGKEYETRVAGYATMLSVTKKGEGQIPATPGKAESGAWDESLYPKKWPNSDKKVKVAHFTDKEEFRFDPTAEPEPGRKGLFVYKLDELKPGQLEQLEREDWRGRWAEYIEVPESSLRDFQRFDENEIPGRAGFTEYFIDSKEFPIPAASPKAEGGNPFKESVVQEPVFHGSPDGEISTFELQEIGKSAADFRGFYFTTDKDYTTKFSDREFKQGSKLAGKSTGSNPHTVTAYIDLRNPFDFTEPSEKYLPALKRIAGRALDEEGRRIFNETKYEGKASEEPVRTLIDNIKYVLSDKFGPQGYMKNNPMGENPDQYWQEYARFLDKNTEGEVKWGEGWDEQLERYTFKKAHWILTDELKKEGFDGIIRPDTIRFEDDKGRFNPFSYKRVRSDNDTFIVFSPDQIKILPNPTRPPEIGGQTSLSIEKAASEGGLNVSRDIDEWNQKVIREWKRRKPDSGPKLKEEEKQYKEDFAKESLGPGKGLIKLWKARNRNWREGKPDTTLLDRTLSVPSHYFEKVEALQKMYEAGLERSDQYYELVNTITKGPDGRYYTEIMDSLRKQRPEEYKEFKEYLVQRDRNQVGYRVVKEKDGDEYLLFDPKKRKIGTFKKESEAWAKAIAEEVRAYKETGVSDLAVESLLSARMITHKGFTILIRNLRDIIAKYEANGWALPSVAVKSEGKKVEVDLKVAVAMMGDMRGYYFPRIRRPGRFMLIARKEGVNPTMEFFDTKTMIARRQLDLEHQGYVVEKDLSPALGEDVFDMAKSIVGMQAQINEALEKMHTRGLTLDDFGIQTTERFLKPGKREILITGPTSKEHNDVFKKMGGRFFESDPGGLRVWHFTNPGAHFEKRLAKALSNAVPILDQETQLLFAKSLAEQVANVIKARGHRAHMIERKLATGADVWVGYEEDPVVALAKYARGLAAGEAKKNMALRMVQAFTGTDISWAQFKEQNEEAEYEEYLAEVERRRINPTRQPNAFRDGKVFMEDMLRNEEWMDRALGAIKGAAVLKYLGFRVAAPAVNLTALVTSVPAVMNGVGGIPINRSFRLLGQAMNAYRQYARGKKARLSPEMVRMFDEMQRKGWDKPQLNQEALAVLEGKLGRGWNKLIETSMWMFGKTEQLNRAATIAASFMGIRQAKPELSFDEALDLAKKVSDRAHGVYRKGNLPFYARGGHIGAQLIKMFYVFRTFSHNYLLTMKEIGIDERNAKAFSYMLLSPALLAGAGSTVAMPIIQALAKALGIGDDDPEEEFYAWLDANLGEYGERFGRSGLFGLAGVSLKGSLQIAIGDIPTKVTDILGAPGSVVTDLYEGGRNLTRGDVLKGVEKLLPNFAASISRAYREKTEGITTRNNAPVFYGAEPLVADTIESIYRAMSFNPARIAGIREKQYRERRVEARYTERRSEIYSRIKKFYLLPDAQRTEEKYMDLLAMVEEYNREVEERGLAGKIPMITGKAIKSNIRRSFRPSRRERMRAAETMKDEGN